jgi:hypothetical protein
MLWILPHHWSSWCMRLIIYLYFLLPSAVVTVLPLNVFMVYTGTTLPFTIVLEEWLQYLLGPNSFPQKMRTVWSHGTVCHPTVLCCVRTQNAVIWWSILNMEAWKPLCVLVFFLCNAHLLSLFSLFMCCSALTTVVWIHDMATSLLCFLKFWGCEMLGLIPATTSGIS